MKLKGFIQFINEYDDKGPISINIAGAPLNLNNDEKLDKEIEKYADKKEEYCPRCEEKFEECKCQEDDQWSTQNFHRTPPGERVEIKRKQDFKKK
jgi:hypothetical protein